MDTAATENLKIKFLTEAEKAVGGLSNALKCHLAICRDTVAEWAGVRIKFDRKKIPLVRCQYCLTNFDETNSIVKIVPKQKSRLLMRKMYKKIRKKNHQLSPFEKNLNALIQKGNKVIVNCFTCHKRTSAILTKPVNEVEKLSPKKRKKKKQQLNVNLSLLDSTLDQVKQKKRRKTTTLKQKAFVLNSDVAEVRVPEQSMNEDVILLEDSDPEDNKFPHNECSSVLATDSFLNTIEDSVCEIIDEKPVMLRYEIDHCKRFTAVEEPKNSIYDIKKSFVPSKKQKKLSVAPEFIPLDSSSPVTNLPEPRYILSTPLAISNKNSKHWKNRQKKKLFMNPLALKNEEAEKSAKKNKNRLSSLQKLLADKKTTSAPTTLKTFLNSLK